jgi:hypothetical protein
MPLREFRDRKGRSWRAWSTVPSHPETVAPDLRNGWLTFEGDGERRRLAPIPREWPTMDRWRLEVMLRASEVIPPDDPGAD